MMSRKARATRCTVIAVLLVAALAAGCYGKFPITRTVYRLNGQATDSKLANSAVMWVFALPLYAPGALTDLAVFNLVEFWTGATLKLGDGPPQGAGQQPGSSRSGPRRWTLFPPRARGVRPEAGG